MPIWLVFCIAATLLVLGYVFYGSLVSRIFGVDEKRATPVQELADGRDYIELPNWKVFLIQLLNIAGMGPIFGPLLGALYGPAALFWIVFGCIFAGAVHDYLSGMLSVRNQGKSIPNICGKYMGSVMKNAMVVFCLLVLVLTGMVFVTGPADLLNELFGQGRGWWLIIIFAYFFLATILPIDKLIGRFYPIFGGLLIFMAVSLLLALFLDDRFSTIPNSYWTSSHPSGASAWPLVFITIACGAVSGFHSTQSPLMSRCLANEKYGRQTFYGAMIAEGLIAMVWVLLGTSFYNNGYDGLNWSNAASVTHKIASTLLGSFGSAIAMLGVIILPITSGDTAFRSARLIVADAFNIEQKSIAKCLAIAVPLFATGFICNVIGFDTLWKYFGWSNQTLATIVLWLGAVYLRKNGNSGLIASIPAMFMTTVVGTFALNNKLMALCLPLGLSTLLSAALALLFQALTWRCRPTAENTAVTEN
ncbi:MAG: carbon starvation protein A [bacterium]|nr:carbon starvation protein A [bacterium]